MIAARWILAFFFAALSWILFPVIGYFLCTWVFQQMPLPLLPNPRIETLEERAMMATAIPGFTGPIVAQGVLLLVLPALGRSVLIGNIIIFSIISGIGSVALSVFYVLGLGQHPIALVISGITGTTVGAILAFSCVSLKSIGALKK
jgi:hypothetical protein